MVDILLLSPLSPSGYNVQESIAVIAELVMGGLLFLP
jgi:hypothetical protein